MPTTVRLRAGDGMARRVRECTSIPRCTAAERPRLFYFPDEGHWVLKPQNAFVWWDTMLGWLDKYIGAPTGTR